MFLKGTDKGGTNEYNIRYKNVTIEELDEFVEIDVTSEKKSLKLEYSSDMCVRDRLSSIQRKYGDDGLQTVIDNILVAKKILKENGVYKKTTSDGATEFGGFGGIGVENWILQNGGSFIKSMRTFLDAAVDKDENGNEIEISFEEFKKRYPIHDFGKNHRDLSKKAGMAENDNYIEGLSESGFQKLKEIFREKLLEFEGKKETKDKFSESIIEFTKETKGYIFSDMSQIYSLIARFRAHQLSKEDNDIGEK